ncbi:MAG TPA: DUF1501 domain-containing protein [Planctomycetaceae bacterium]|nr:DUF1501 domain-containing protein [Planctomycetaceae bacterium]
MMFSTPTRRDLLKGLSCGFGYAALAGLAAEAAAADTKRQDALAPLKPHFAPRAKRVIFLCMRGGPSHVDTFDHKPQLAVDNGKPAPGKKNRKLMESPWAFKQHGQSGQWISELFPNVAGHADDLCVLNGMHADVPSHPECFVQLHTGSFQFVRPSMGAWVLYGLGTENANLPGFITLNPPSRVGGAQNYGSSFLPAVYQGTRIGQLGQSLKTATIGNLKNPRLDRSAQRRQIDFVQSLNRGLIEKRQSDEQLESVIESYELAFRMQSELPKVLSLSKETAKTQQAYGVDAGPTDNFGRQCLLARRLAEAGVPLVNISYCHTPRGSWDTHSRNFSKMKDSLAPTLDQSLTALIEDLDQRGMLDETLVVVNAEFGRTPKINKNAGRDHWPWVYSLAMAGAGANAGTIYGASDDSAAYPASNPHDPKDFVATLYHLLGVPPETTVTDATGRPHHVIIGQPIWPLVG